MQKDKQTDRQMAFQLYIVHHSIQKQRTTAKELCMAHGFIHVLVQVHKFVFTSLVCLYQAVRTDFKGAYTHILIVARNAKELQACLLLASGT